MSFPKSVAYGKSGPGIFPQWEAKGKGLGNEAWTIDQTSDRRHGNPAAICGWKQGANQWHRFASLFPNG